VNQANKGQPVRRKRVSYWCVAAAGVPTKQAALRQAHACESLGARRDRQVRWRHLKDIGAAMRVQDVRWTSKKMREGLAVIAVADRVVTRSG
jgi:hypothetical protein